MGETSLWMTGSLKLEVGERMNHGRAEKRQADAKRIKRERRGGVPREGREDVIEVKMPRFYFDFSQVFPFSLSYPLSSSCSPSAVVPTISPFSLCTPLLALLSQPLAQILPSPPPPPLLPLLTPTENWFSLRTTRLQAARRRITPLRTDSWRACARRLTALTSVSC